MKKLFISQPMRGKTEEEIMAVRAKAIESAENHLGEKVEVIDSFLREDTPTGINRPLWCLGKSLMLMADADVVYFAKDWADYRGCRIENEAANEYDIPLIIEDYRD